MSEKELRARIDRVIAEEERTYGRLIELLQPWKASTKSQEEPANSEESQAQHHSNVNSSTIRGRQFVTSSLSSSLVSYSGQGRKWK